MEILEIIKNRRSVRSFQKKEIEEKIIEKLIEALLWAPSAGNLQSRKFYFIFNDKIKEMLTKAAFNQNFFKEAPLVIVACADNKITKIYGQRGKDLYSICDVSASIQNLMLLAYSENLGTCWIGAFDEEEVKKTLNLPDYLKPIAIVPVGFSVKKPSPPPRVKKSEAIVIIK